MDKLFMSLFSNETRILLQYLAMVSTLAASISYPAS